MVLCRFCSKHDSTHIGTRKRSSIQDIKEDSDTRKESENQYPIKSRSEVILTSWEVKEMKDEIP